MRAPASVVVTTDDAPATCDPSAKRYTFDRVVAAEAGRASAITQNTANTVAPIVFPFIALPPFIPCNLEFRGSRWTVGGGGARYLRTCTGIRSDAELVGPSDQLGLRGHAQLGVHVDEVALDRALADDQPLRDLAGRLTSRRQHSHLALAAAQRFGSQDRSPARAALTTREEDLHPVH